VVDDKLGSPTYNRDFTRTMAAVIGTGTSGLYHVVGEGECSRFEIAREILRHFGLEETISLVKVTSEYWKKEYFAPRPRSERLINLKLQLRRIAGMPHWKESLAHYLDSHDWQIA
jgi:dTDP-4-dehydrorhamnose reductase